MRAFLVTLALIAGLVPATATEHTIAQAESDAANVKTLVLNGSANESTRLLKLAPKLIALETVILDGITNDETAKNLVSSVAACSHVGTINFRSCVLSVLPSNLRMLTQVKSFESENTTVTDNEQFYNAIADMPNVENVTVTGNDFRSLPKSFSRMRVMNNINLVNNDLQLASGYDLNNKTPDQLRATESVQFGFGDDALNLNYTCYNAEAGKSHVQMFRDVLQGAYRQSNVFYSPAASRAFVKKHPLVKPPVAGMDVYPDVYSYSAMTGTTIEYGSGTKLSIPALAFEDAYGATVTGDVDITYREFRDPVDIVLSGIPMKYDSGGVAGDFESAGMFEINASHNGNEVFLKDDKNIGVTFAVVDTASTYNFYRLDEQKGWQYLDTTGKVEREMVPVADSTVEKPWSDAVTYYVNNLGEISVGPLTEDTTSFDRRYLDTAYVGNYKYENSKGQYYYREKRKRSCNLYLRKFGSGTDYTLVRIARSKAYTGNPEIDAYSGYYWKINGKQSAAQLRTEYGKKTGISDCRIINDGGQFYIELKYSWGFRRIAAEPVKMDEHKRAQSITDRMSNHLFDVYNKRLNQRRGKLSAGIAKTTKQYQKKVERATKDSTRIFTKTIPKMTDAETPMAFPEWNNYVKAERLRTLSARDRAWAATGDAVQALSIPGMGIYNCDQVRRLNNPVTAVAAKVKVAGAVIVPFIVYVIDKARNMVLTYTGNGGGVPITYGKNATNSLMMIDGTGSLYVSGEDQFNAGVRNSGDAEFEGVKVSGPESNPQTVREAVFPERKE
jgi:hypothetical protein